MARFVGLGALRLERVGTITDVLQRRDDVGGGELFFAPVDRKPPVGEIEPRLDDARQALQPALNLADAAGAAHALDRQIHVRGAFVAPHKHREIERLSHGMTSVQYDAIARTKQTFAVA